MQTHHHAHHDNITKSLTTKKAYNIILEDTYVGNPAELWFENILEEEVDDWEEQSQGISIQNKS